MADEVGLAKGIGGRIGKGSGSLGAALRKYAKDKDKNKEKTKKTTDEPKSSEKTKSTPKQSGRQTIFVNSTVVDRTPTQPVRDPQKALPAPQKALPGGERWEAFKQYVDSTKDSPTVDLTDLNK